MTTSPKIVLFDLETLPDLKEVMRVFPGLSNYPGLTLKAEINSIICFGYKVFGEKKTHCINAWDFPSWKKNPNDDRELLKAACEVLKDADGVVTHNGKRFDWKFLQTRLAIHDMDALPKIKHTDTCTIARRNLLMFNNQLKTLAKQLTDREKLDNGGWDLWVKVSDRDPAAMKLMEKYCIHDVEALEAVYRRLRPFATDIPNHNLFGSEKVNLCPSCGSSRIIARGYAITKTKRYQRFSCNDCGSWSQTTLSGHNPKGL